MLSVVLAAASMLFVGVHVAGHKQLSPYDEYVYVDYYVKAVDQGVVRQGEMTGDYARRYLLCHGVRVLAPNPSDRCGRSASPPSDAVPMYGLSTGGIHAPVYFLTTRLLAEPLFAIGGVDLVAAGRFASGLWLAFAAVVLYRALRRLGCSNPIAFSVGLALAGAGVAQWANTYISIDATALAAGAAMLWMALWYLERPSWRRSSALVACASFFTLAKLQNIEAVVVVALFLLGTAAYEVGRSQDRELRSAWRWASDKKTLTAVLAVVASVLSQGVWMLVRAGLSLGPDPDQNVSKTLNLPQDLIDEVFRFWPGTVSSGALDQGPWAALAATVLGLLVVGGVLGLAVGRGVPSRDRILAWSVLIASLASGPVLALVYRFSTGMYVPLVPRYGLALVPAMLACVALLPPRDSRAAKVAAVVLGSLMFVAGLLATS